MHCIRILQAEHYVLRDVLDGFEALLAGVGRDDHRALDLALDVIEWFERSADGVHQSKEELGLLPSMLHAAPEIARAALTQLVWLHATERERLEALRASLTGVASDPTWDSTRFVAAGRAYVEFQRHHVTLEDQAILPRAREVLQESDDAEILRTYAEIERTARSSNLAEPHVFAAWLQEKLSELALATTPGLADRGCDDPESCWAARNGQCSCVL